MNKIFLALTIAAVMAASLRVSAQSNVYSRVTYQGFLKDYGISPNDSNGHYDFRYGVVIGPLDPDNPWRTNCPTCMTAFEATNSIVVNQGLFTTTLLMPTGMLKAGFMDGTNVFLEFAIRTNGSGAFTTLEPLQPLSATPYATVAQSVSGPISADSLTGSLPSSQLDGSYGNALSFLNPSNIFVGDGSLLANVDATTIGGMSPCSLPCYWNALGNSGTDPNVNFLGTADNAGLTLRVNNQPVLRFRPDPNGANIIGGHPENQITGNDSSVIAGGGRAGAPNQIIGETSVIGGGIGNQIGAMVANVGYAGRASFIGGGSGNQIVLAIPNVPAEWDVISGGQNNTISGVWSVIGGGDYNWVEHDHSTIGGGAFNHVADKYATIAGGVNNVALDTGSIGGGFGNSAGLEATVSGGTNNVASATAGAIGGGTDNRAQQPYSTVSGGMGNNASASWASVGGGNGNSAAGQDSVVAGGSGNSAIAGQSAVGGGLANNAGGIASTIGGGQQNTNSAQLGTIGGGIANRASGNFSTVGGGNANQVTGQDAVIGGGSGNKALGGQNTVSGGIANTTSGTASTVLGGQQNSATNDFSVASGRGGITRMPLAQAAGAMFLIPGDAQGAQYILTGLTTNLVTVNLLGPAVPVSGTIAFSAMVSAKAFGNFSGGFEVKGIVRNYGGSVNFAGAPTITPLGQDAASLNVTALIAGNQLALQVTGITGFSVRWVATLRTSEVVF